MNVLADVDLAQRIAVARAKPVSEMTQAELWLVLRPRGFYERPLSAADQYRAEHPLSLSCMPDHHS